MNKIIFLLFISPFLFSCYTLTQGTTYLGYLCKAVPLESLLKDDSTETEEAEKNRRFVEMVQDIRRFATEELGLNMTKNYTRYVKIDRDYLAAVVSASAADSFERHEWSYPIVGRMPYKGFFKTNDARKERAKLEKKGLDVWVRGVDAFSTLGWFRDPLFSYMQNYSPYRLADLIIHESVHATVFLKGQVKFNEELAVFVGKEGARLYMESRFGFDSEEYQAMITADKDSQVFITFIQELAAQLELLFDSDINRETKLLEKEKIINAAKERFYEDYENMFTNENYRGFIDLPVNNAYIDLFRLYYSEDSDIPGLFEKSGIDLPAFIAAAKTIPDRGSSRRIPPGERFALILENNSTY